MKKIMFFVACSSLLLSSCDTYTGSGAYAGATFSEIFSEISLAAAEAEVPEITAP